MLTIINTLTNVCFLIDVIFYAKLIGIDPFIEPYLLWIAQAGLVSPLPVGWIAA